MQDGRITWAELGQRLGLSPPAAAERVRRLEEQGVIEGYRATANAERLGFGVLAFVYVTLGPKGAAAFQRFARAHPMILECHHLAGDDDYLLKVRCRRMSELETFLVDDLKGRNGVARTRTTIALGTAKETMALPV
jgi:Lrp/AsnC family leucine-responsive transcriptional regulator